MSGFDFDAYLANRIDADNKLKQVSEASKEKLAQLQATSDEKKAELAPKTAAWSDQLGLAPGSFEANRVNDAASLVSGASRLAGQVASLPVSIAGAAMSADATPEDYAAYNRVQTGNATAEDWARLNQRTSSSQHTILEGLRADDQARVAARQINDTADLGGIVNQQNRQGLSEDLGKGFDENWAKVQTGEAGQVAKGLAGLIFNAGSALAHNPSAVREYVLENAPQLFVGALGKAGQVAMGASNVGYAVDEYQKGIENFQKANGGQLPPEDMRQRMALQAASLAAAEEGGDLIGLGATKMLGHAAEDVTRGGLLTTAKRATGAALEGAAGETPTEGYQQYMEGQVEGTPQTPRQIYEAAVIGGASGAALSGGGRALHELSLPPEKKSAGDEPAPAPRANQAEITAARTQAAETGDVSPLTDLKSPTYAPDHAIAALMAHSQKADTSEETKQANLDKAGDILRELQSKHEMLSERLMSPEARQALVATYQQLAAKATDPEEKAGYQHLVDATINDAKNPMSADKARATRDELARTTSQLARAAKIHGSLEALVRPTQKVQDLVDAADAPSRQATPDSPELKAAKDLVAAVDEGGVPLNPAKLRSIAEGLGLEVAKTAAPEDTVQRIKDAVARAGGATTQKDSAAAAERVVNLAMSSPHLVTSAHVQQLVSNTGNGLTTQQREFLRQFDAARQAQNALRNRDRVGKEIADGSPTNLGIKQYREWIGDAVARGDQKTADKYMALLQNFTQDHEEKAVKTAEAAALPGLKHVARTADGQWVIRDGHLPDAQRKANGAVNVQPNSRLIPDIRQEADAISATAAAMKAAYDTKFNSTGGASNVQNASRQGADQGAQRQAAEVQGAGAPGAVAEPAGAQPAAGVAEPHVQAAGVAEKAPAAAASPARTSVDSGVSDTSVNQLKEDSSSSEGLQSTQRTEKTVERDATVAGQAGSTESTVEKSPETENTHAPQDVSVTPGVDQSPEGTAYRSRNLVRDFFKQTAGRVGDATQRPLATVKDFLTHVTMESVLPFLGLKSAEDLTDPQKKLFQHFETTAMGWFGTIRANLFKREAKPGAKSNPDDFRYEDMMKFLLQQGEDGLDVVENVKTAMSYAAYSFIAENAARSPFNNDAEINAILDRAETTIVGPRERALLRDIGTRQNVIINTLGQRAVAALGLKAVKDAPLDLQARFESAIGAHVFKLLLDEGIIQRTPIAGSVLAELGMEVEKQHADNQFVKLAEDQDGAFHPKVVEISQATKNTQGALDKLFGVEAGLKEPSIGKPIPYEQLTTKNTRQKVPSLLEKIMQRENDTPFFVRQDMWKLMQQLSDKLMMDLAGAEEVEGKHIYNAKSVTASADSLQREVERFRGFVGGMADTKEGLYFEHVVWKQQRVGIATNVINPQTSKVHRHMLYRAAWETTVTPRTGPRWRTSGFAWAKAWA
jgi:hypothetical protein